MRQAIWAFLVIAFMAMSSHVGAQLGLGMSPGEFAVRIPNSNAQTIGNNCSQGATYIAALTSPTTPEQNAFKTLICSMVAHGTYNNVLGLYLHFNTSAANARVNAVHPGTFNLTGHGTCAFTADVGFTGDGSTCYNDPGFVPSVNGGGVMTQNGTTIGHCVLSPRTTSSTSTAYGAIDASNHGIYFLSYFLSPTLINGGALNSAGGDFASAEAGAAGAWTYTRDATGVTVYLNGVAQSTNQGAGSTGLPSVGIVEFARNNNATIDSFTSDQQAYWFFGNLNSAQIQSIYADIGVAMTALGIPGGCSNNFAAVPTFFSTAGNDANNCTSTGTSCQTIAKANALLLGPNSSINFNGGDTFTGCLSLTSANATPNALNPIAVTSYGTGRPRITTNCSGGFSAGLTLDAVRGVHVSNIDFVQGGNSPPTMACILITNTAGAVQSGDYLIENNTCTGGFTSQGGGVSSLSGGGIVIRGFTGGCAPINNVTIRNNTIFGAAVTSPDQNGIFGSDGCTSPNNLNNYTAQGNLIFNIGGTNPNTGTNPGNGILFIDGSNTLQQFNFAHDLAWNCTVSPGCGVAFWNDQVNIAEIKFSEAYSVQPGFSTAGTDFDCTDQDQGVTNGLTQYMYCHGNFGYGMTGVMAGTGGWGPNTVRYSITENDNKRTGDLTAGLISYFDNGAPGLLYVYNVTIWANQTTSPTRTAGYGNQSGWPSGGMFANNIVALTQDSFGLFSPITCVNVDATTIAVPFHHNDYFAINGGTQQFYTCGAGGTSIPFATWAAAITGAEASTIQTAPGFVGTPPDASGTWPPSTQSPNWAPSGLAGDVALATGAQNAKGTGAALAASSWPGGLPDKDFNQNNVPGIGGCFNIGAYGVC